MPTTPQDRKPRKVTRYTFTANGVEYSLPLASKGAEKISGRVLRDAAVSEAGEARLGFVLLEACGAKQDAVDAILDLPAPECLRILGEWIDLGDGDGASLPQS